MTALLGIFRIDYKTRIEKQVLQSNYTKDWCVITKRGIIRKEPIIICSDKNQGYTVIFGYKSLCVIKSNGTSECRKWE